MFGQSQNGEGVHGETNSTQYAAVVHSSPAIAPDGTIYFTAADDHLHALDPSGNQKWSAPLGDGDSPSSPAIGASGTVYAADFVDFAGAVGWHVQNLTD